MLIVSKAFLISSTTVIVQAGGSIWLNHFATVLFNVCSAVYVVFCTRVACVCVWYVFCYVRMLFYIVFAITEMRDMGLYEVSLSMSLGFGMGTMLLLRRSS